MMNKCYLDNRLFYFQKYENILRYKSGFQIICINLTKKTIRIRCLHNSEGYWIDISNFLGEKEF